MSGTTFAVLSIGTGYFYLQTGSTIFMTISVMLGVFAVGIGLLESW